MLNTLASIGLIAGSLITLADPSRADPISKGVLAIVLIASLLGSNRALLVLGFATFGANVASVSESMAPLWTFLCGFTAWRLPLPQPNMRVGLAAILGAIPIAAATLIFGPFEPLFVLSAVIVTLSLGLLFRRARIILVAALASAALFVNIGVQQYRHPGILFYAFDHWEPSLLGVFGRTLRGHEEERYENVEFLPSYGDRYYLADDKSWISDNGARLLSVASSASMVAAEWIRTLWPEEKLKLVTLVTPEVCAAARRMSPTLDVFQDGVFLNPRPCGQWLEGHRAQVAVEPHVMVFPADEHGHDEDLLLPPGSAHGSRWRCYSAYLGSAFAKQFTPIESGFDRKKAPTVPYVLRIASGYCLLTAGPEFFADRRVLDRPIIHRALLFQENRE